MNLADIARAQLIAAVDNLLSVFANVSAAPPTARMSERSVGQQLTSEHRRFSNIAELLTKWHSDSKSVLDDGTPRGLPRAGRGASLVALARSVTDANADAEQLVSDLISFGVVVDRDGLYYPSRRAAVLPSANALNLAHATTTATRLLGTISHNVSPGRQRIYERQVAEVSIRNADLPAYLRFVEQQAQNLIDTIDDWLESRKTSEEVQDGTTRVGVAAFAWVDPAPPASDAPRDKRRRPTAGSSSRKRLVPGSRRR